MSVSIPTFDRLPFPVYAVKSLDENGYDSIVVVSNSLDNLTGQLGQLQPPLKALKEVDRNVERDVSLVSIPLPAKRLVYSATGPLNRDFDDVRRFRDAAAAGIKRALKAGSVNPLLVTIPYKEYEHSFLVSTLGALEALYVPIQLREDIPERSKRVEKLGVYTPEDWNVLEALKLAVALDSGRQVARDIGGGDPERMAPPRVEQYVKDVFKNSPVSVKVIADENILEKDYPLFAAVNRAASVIDRHKGRILQLQYDGEGPIKDTLLLVGKGVTYDTGGADVKAGGVMAGMSRDKCGAAAVAGLFQVLSALKPKGIKVIGGMAMVRNSIGENCYVADEMITSRAGQRVRVGNTDAEGRMAMADVLCYMKELAVKEVNPHLFTIATLTGHAVLAMGEGYSVVLDNGAARNDGNARKLQDAGTKIADMFEISNIRREDYEFHEGKVDSEDLLQCNNAPSSKTPRGHQTPAAFLIMASGLHQHGIESSKPLKYSHLDIAGSSGEVPFTPSGAPLLALAQRFILGNKSDCHCSH